MKKYAHLFILLTSLQCNAQRKFNSTAIDHFLQWYVGQLEEPSISEMSIRLDKEMLAYLKPETLSKTDSLSITAQIQGEETKFLIHQLPGKILLTQKEEKQQLEKGTYLFAKVSRPVFAGDNVWIYTEHYCGDSCGSGELRLYKKGKNKLSSYTGKTNLDKLIAIRFSHLRFFFCLTSLKGFEMGVPIPQQPIVASKSQPSVVFPALSRARL